MNETTPHEANAPDSPRRWLVLAVYALAAALSQMLWLNFAPILIDIERRYQVSEDVAGLLILVFPLVYVLLSAPAGTLVDRRGYRAGLLLGAALMAGFACLRVHVDSFWVLLAAQVGIAAGQPFVVNGISALVLDWFGKEEEAIATGLGTAGMFIGMAVGLAATPPLVEGAGLRGGMAVLAGASIAVLVAVHRVITPNPARAGAGASHAGRTEPLSAHFRALAADRDLVLVFVMAALGLGFFNGLTTWLEPILAPQGIDAGQAGLVGAALIVGGIVGAIVVPALSDRTRRRKPWLAAGILVALACVWPLCTVSSYPALLALGALLGFAFLPAFSLLLEMASELAGPERAGAATGILMLAGNAGGVLVIIAMQAVKSDTTGYRPSIVLMMATLAVGAMLALLVRETHRSRRPESR